MEVCPQTTSLHGRQYKAENRNLWKLGPTFRYGAVFAPKQYLYQKEARPMESQKDYSSSQCKKHTYLCGSANYLVSWKAILSQEQKFGKIRAYLSPWVQCLHQSSVYTKEKLGLWRAQKCICLVSAKKRTYLRGSANYPVSWKAVQGRELKFG